MTDEVLSGGVDNRGRVVRSGRYVLRPASRFSPSIHRFLTALADAGFDGVPRPAGLLDDGRERLAFVPGDVAIPPYPAWVQTDAALRSLVELLGRFHRASSGFDPAGLDWNRELADPEGGSIVTHNDVCPENVVFRSGRAVALIDFDFAAPGRPSFDLAALARMCVPVDDPVNAARLGWLDADRPARLGLVADTYGLDRADRVRLLGHLDTTIGLGGEFVRRRAEAGEPGFVEMWQAMGGRERFDRRRNWWDDERSRFERALVR